MTILRKICFSTCFLVCRIADAHSPISCHLQPRETLKTQQKPEIGPLCPKKLMAIVVSRARSFQEK